MRDIRDNSFLVHSANFCSYRCLGCLRLLIAIFRLEVRDVVIMSKSVIVSSCIFSIVTDQGFYWDIR